MPVTTIVGLVVIIGMFAAFMVALGGTALWVAIPDWRKAAASRRAERAPAPTATQGVRPTRA